MSPLFIDTSLNAELLPELNLDAVEPGKPMPGTTIRPLPDDPLRREPAWRELPHCKAPADWLEPNLVKPIAVPK